MLKHLPLHVTYSSPRNRTQETELEELYKHCDWLGGTVVGTHTRWHSFEEKLTNTMHSGSGPELYLLHMNQTYSENSYSFPHEFSYSVHPHGI